MGANEKKPQSIDEVVKQVSDAVKPYIEKAMETAEPYIEKAMETAEPYVKEAKEKAGPALKKARTKAEPAIRQAREKTEPVIKEMKSRAAKAATKTDVFLQYGDHELRVEDLVEKAREDYFAHGGTPGSLKTLRVYLKPEDHTAYYVANHDETGKVGF